MSVFSRVAESSDFTTHRECLVKVVSTPKYGRRRTQQMGISRRKIPRFRHAADVHYYNILALETKNTLTTVFAEFFNASLNLDL